MGRLGHAGRVEMRSWLELRKIPFSVPAIIIRPTKPDATALDDLLPWPFGLQLYTLPLDYGLTRRSVKNAIAILYVVQSFP